MPFQIVCPHCAQGVQVYEEHAGKTVVCPICSRTFVASRTMPNTAPPPPPALEHIRTPDTDRVRQRVFAPSIGLLAAGFINILVSAAAVPGVFFPEEVGMQPIQDPVEWMFTVIFMVVMVILGIVTMYGADQLRLLGSYKWAVAGAAAALLPLNCCILGPPFGIWALILLIDDEVRQAFPRRPFLR